MTWTLTTILATSAYATAIAAAIIAADRLADQGGAARALAGAALVAASMAAGYLLIADGPLMDRRNGLLAEMCPHVQNPSPRVARICDGAITRRP